MSSRHRPRSYSTRAILFAGAALLTTGGVSHAAGRGKPAKPAIKRPPGKGPAPFPLGQYLPPGKGGKVPLPGGGKIGKGGRSVPGMFVPPGIGPAPFPLGQYLAPKIRGK